MSTKNLYKENAREKIKEIVEDIHIGMMITKIGHKPLSVIPMSTKKVDEFGNLWFLSKSTSEHNKNIEADEDVQLVYSDHSQSTYLSVFGTAIISTNKVIINELYQKLDNNWFDGIKDQELTAICVEPKTAYYWDSTSNKYIEFFKMGLNAYADTNYEIGQEGKLEV